MKNHYETIGDTTVIYLPRRDKEPLQTLISTSDLERVKEFPNTWYANFTDEVNQYYVKGFRYKKIYLHRWIAGARGEIKIDHINHDSLDNRRENLRIVTNAENMQNRKQLSSNNTSGARNVGWQDGKWAVYFTVNGQQMYFGRYALLEDAIEASRFARAFNMPGSLEAMEMSVSNGRC